jgi:hypothetical protein
MALPEGEASLPDRSKSECAAADAAREVAGEVRDTARQAQTRAKRTARQARKVPRVAQVEGQLKGAVASEQDLAIAGYDSLSAAEIVSQLQELSQIDLAKIDSYERRHENRTTVLSRVTALRRREPWPGYDELTVAEIEAVLGEGDAQRTKDVAAYEHTHKTRAGVLRSTERETANT